MKKLSLILLVLLTVAAASPVFAEAPLFNALYWVQGTTVTFNQDKDGLALLPADYAKVATEQRDAIFYKNLPGTYLSTKLVETGPNPSPDPLNNGKYMINIYDKAGLEILPQGKYYVAVPRGSDDFGADPVEVVVTGNGFEVANKLKIVKGAGPILPLPGAVQLYISRVPNTKDIKIAWNDSELTDEQKPPKIFGLQTDGDGTGSYKNIFAFWSQKTGQGVFDETHAAEGYYLHKGQVAKETGAKEYYYKGLWKNLDSDSQYNSQNILESAWAVGKVDLAIGAGMNVVAVPFQSDDASIGGVFNPDLLTSGDYLYYKPQSDSSNTIKATIVGNNWDVDLSIAPKFGYWIKAQNPKVLTVWGNVLSENAPEIMVKESGILLVGTVFPVLTPFVDAGLSVAGGSKPGDVVYSKPSASTPNTLMMTFDGSVWGTGDSIKFKLPYGYWYKRKAGNADFSFIHLRPW